MRGISTSCVLTKSQNVMSCPIVAMASEFFRSEISSEDGFYVLQVAFPVLIVPGHDLLVKKLRLLGTICGRVIVFEEYLAGTDRDVSSVSQALVDILLLQTEGSLA